MGNSEIVYNPEKLQELIIVRNKDGLYSITYKKCPEEVIRYRGKFEYKKTIEDEFEITQCNIKSIKIKVEIEEEINGII